MACEKKPVNGMPNYDPDYVRRIDPVWFARPVPKGFWEDERIAAITCCGLPPGSASAAWRPLWARILENRRPEPPLRAVPHWGTVALAAVQDCFPEYDWKPWLFPKVPQGFGTRRPIGRVT